MAKRADTSDRDRGLYTSVATVEEVPLVRTQLAELSAPPSGFPSPAKTTFAQQKDIKKWRVFPGKNRFFCDGRFITSRQMGVFYLTCGLIVVTSGLFFAFDCRFLSENVSPAIPVVSVILFLFVMCTLFRTAFSDPGIIPRATPEESEQTERRIEQTADGVYRPPPRIKEVIINGQLMKLKYCFTCKIFRPPRSSHCSVCDNCVERFDHHCPWVGNCIGKRNYRYFYMFLVFLSLHCTMVLSFSVTTLVLGSLQSDFVTALKDSPTSLLEAVIAFLSVWSVFGLAGFHTYLSACNVTTNEDIKKTSGQANSSVNFGHKSVCANYCEVVCGPIPPSLIDRRGLANADTPEVVVNSVTERCKTSLNYSAWSEQNHSARPPPGAAVYAWGTPDEPPIGGPSWNHSNNSNYGHEMNQMGISSQPPIVEEFHVASNGSIPVSDAKIKTDTKLQRLQSSPSVYTTPPTHVTSPRILSPSMSDGLTSPGMLSPSLSVYMTPSVSLMGGGGRSPQLTSPTSLLSMYATPSASLTPVTQPIDQTPLAESCMSGHNSSRPVAL